MCPLEPIAVVLAAVVDGVSLALQLLRTHLLLDRVANELGACRLLYVLLAA